VFARDFSPTGLSLNSPAHRFHKAFPEEIVYRDHGRLGDVIPARQAGYAQTGAFPELLSIYHLLGDPALRLRYDRALRHRHYVGNLHQRP